MSICSCHVTYWVTRDLDERCVDAALGLLSPDERARHAKFVPSHTRRDFAAAHALLRAALSALVPRSPHAWQFVGDGRGKPAIMTAGPDQHVPAFNLSHTDGLVACAICVDRGVDVGIDVERVDRRLEPLDLARRYFSVREIRAIEDCVPSERAARFIEVWTLKEAYVKAIGDGLACPLDRFGFVFDEPAGIRLETLVGNGRGRWQFGLFRVSGTYRLAVAIRSASTTRCGVIVHRLDAGAGGASSATSHTLLRSSTRLDIAGAIARVEPELVRS